MKRGICIARNEDIHYMDEEWNDGYREWSRKEKTFKGLSQTMPRAYEEYEGLAYHFVDVFIVERGGWMSFELKDFEENFITIQEES